MFSAVTRNKNLKRLQEETFDLVVIGGGISGAGVARDAAGRGMRVALVEAQDFAAGTSSRSSKLIHGGIRYLEKLEFGLVFEALRERRNLFEMAPHLVHPLRFVLPLYKGGRVGMTKLGLGMWLYDALSMFEAPELHQRLNQEDCLERVPGMKADGLLGGYAYSDAYMDDDRLVIETLRSAHSWGAVCANYTRATGAEFIDGKLSTLICQDEISKNTVKIRGRHFVSTVGPWTDMVATDLLGLWRKLMRPSKGIHLTLDRSRLKLNDAVVMISDDEKRIVFAIPRHEMLIIGTTDTDFSGDPKDVHSTRDDVDYLMNVVHNYFPGAGITEHDILASYAGVRPLVDDGSETESQTSREHLILADPRNVTFVTGGKYTTYRQIAEDTLTVALENYSIEERVRWSNSRSLEPLNPQATVSSQFKALQQVEQIAYETGLDVDTVHFLAERHAGEIYSILNRCGWGLIPGASSRLWEIEARHAIQETMCMTLKDFYLRRSPLFLARRGHGFELLDGLSHVFQAELGWSDATRQSEVSAVREHLKHEMGWRQTH